GPSRDEWRVWLIALIGESLTGVERAIFTSLTGRPQEPGELLEEAWAICGRRSGKTRSAAIFAAYADCALRLARDSGSRRACEHTNPEFDHPASEQGVWFRQGHLHERPRAARRRHFARRAQPVEVRRHARRDLPSEDAYAIYAEIPVKSMTPSFMFPLS